MQVFREPKPTRALHTDLQRDLVTTSRQGCQLIVAEAGHDIVGDAPDVVIQGMRAMVDTVRKGGSNRVCQAEHVAGHGVVAPNPPMTLRSLCRPGVVTTIGVWTWVVVSCNSGSDRSSRPAG